MDATPSPDDAMANANMIRLSPGIRGKTGGIEDPAAARDDAPLRDGSRDNTAAIKPVPFAPSLFVWRDPTTIPRRQFIYGKHLTRGTVSATVAPGGVGKSSQKLVDAVAMAIGRDLVGDQPARPLRVWYINLEDDLEESERKVAAILIHFRIDPSELGDRLYIDGRDTCSVCVAEQTRDGVKIVQPMIAGLTAALIAGKFDVLIVDPFVSAHRVSENDNNAIDTVVKMFAHIAGSTGSASELVHHSRKTNGAEITAEDSRGGSATVAATRSTRVLNRMNPETAEKLGVDDKTRRRIFRLDDDKQNLAPPQDARWFQIVSVGLGNGSGGDTPDQDYVGVVDRWALPNPLDGVSVAHLRAVQAKVAAGRYRESSQAKNWVGTAVAEVLGLNLNDKAAKAKVKGLLKTWIKSRMFKVVSGTDEKRTPRPFVEVDLPAND